MYFIHCLLFVIAVTSVTCGDGKLPPELYLYDLEYSEVHFKDFIRKFAKNYGADYEYRFGVFKDNLKKINRYNLMEKINVHGVTQFSDMTDEEFLDYAGCVTPEHINLTNSNVINMESLPVEDYPAELDYRNYQLVTEVKDQGSCGSAYIFSAVGNIEGQYAKKYGQLVSLSAKEVLDCMNVSGCYYTEAVGDSYNVMQSIASFGGLVLESDYPYSPAQNACTVNKGQIVARVATGIQLPISEDGLVVALNMYGPISVTIHADRMMADFKGGKVFKEANCTQSPYYFGVLLIGYGNAPDGPYWLIKTSWGTSWAEEGYFRLARGVNMCGIGQFISATARIA